MKTKFKVYNYGTAIRFIAFKHLKLFHLNRTCIHVFSYFSVESENIMKLCMAEKKIKEEFHQTKYDLHNQYI